jgi:hypothetical protein
MALALCIASVSMGQVTQKSKSRVPRVLEAEEFVLKDASGRQLAALHGQGGTPQFTLYDADGNPKLSITVAKDGTAAIVLGDAAGRNKASLIVLANGQSGLSLRGGTGSAMMAVTNDKTPNVEILDQAGRVLFHAVR